MMEVRYTNTKEELIEYAIHQRVSGPAFREEVKTTRRMYYFMAGITAIWGLFNLITYFSTQDGNKLSTAISMVFVSLVTFGFSFLAASIQKWFSTRAVRKEIEKNNGELSEMILKIDSRNLYYDSKTGKGTCRLTEEIDAEETGTCIYLETRKAVFIVPKRVFTDETMAEFRHMLNMEDRLKKTKDKNGGKKA